MSLVDRQLRTLGQPRFISRRYQCRRRIGLCAIPVEAPALRRRTRRILLEANAFKAARGSWTRRSRPPFMGPLYGAVKQLAELGFTAPT